MNINLFVNIKKKIFLFLACIHWIKKEKTGAPFHLSSPILFDISGAASWEKVSTVIIFILFN